MVAVAAAPPASIRGNLPTDRIIRGAAENDNGRRLTMLVELTDRFVDRCIVGVLSGWRCGEMENADR